MHFNTTAGPILNPSPTGKDFNSKGAKNKNRLNVGRDANGELLKLFRIMRLTAILLLSACITASAKGRAQRVTLNEKNAPLETVFAKIEKQTGYTFTYTETLLTKAKPVTVHITNGDLQQALALCFKDQPFGYTLIDKTVAVRLKDEIAKEEELNAAIPPIDVKGRIVNEKGEPVIASVQVKGTGKGTTTNDNGEFELKGVDDNATLVISGVSIQTFEWKVAGKTDLVLNAKIKTVQGEEVQIMSTGYQDIPKERATGSFVKIDNELLNRSVSTNILNRLNGVTTGLLYNANGDGVLLRGISSIFSENGPLIVVDGFPYSENNSGINDINPNDVESITILKDAAAASIWGVKAGNGVIVITTKKGRLNQKIKVEINSNTTIADKPDLNYVKTISSRDEIDFEKQLFSIGFYNDYDNSYAQNGYFPAVSQITELFLAQQKGALSQNEVDQKIKMLENHDVKSDMKKYFLQPGINSQHQLNISGGGQNYLYYASVGYDKDKSTSIGSDYTRFSSRFDNTWIPVNKLELTGMVSYTQSDSRANGFDLVSLIPSGNGVAPYSILADEFGNAAAIPLGLRLAYADTAMSPKLLDWHYRPLDELNNKDNDSKQFDTRIGTGLKYSFFPGLNIELKYLYQKVLTNTWGYYNQQTYYTRNLINEYMYVDPNTGDVIYPIPTGGILDNSSTELTAWNIRGQVNFERRWGSHQFSALLGGEQRQINSDQNHSRFYGYDPNTNTFSSDMDYKTSFQLTPAANNGSSKIPQNNGLSGILQRGVSYYTNASYTFNDKYTISGSARADGSNFFGIKTNQKIVPLWSTGLLWNISNENFYKINWLSYLKLRLTYGFNGNTNNSGSAYPLIRYSAAPPYSLNGLQYAYVTSPPNPQFRWEKVKTINAGIDFGIKNGLINGSLQYYIKQGIDLVGQITADATTGVRQYTGNNAGLKTHGVDLALNVQIVNRQIKWLTTLNFSYNTDKVTSYAVPAKTVYDYFGSAPVIGKPLYSLYSFKWAGLDPITGDPRAYLADTIANYSLVNSKAGTGDLIYNGPATPTVFGSLLNAISWKNISLSFNVIYKFHYYFRRHSINYTNLIYGWGGSADYVDRWKVKGDEMRTNVPSATLIPDLTRDFVYQQSSALVEKGDNVKLQDIRLSYSLTPPKLKLLHFQQAQFYVYISNVGLLWKANKYGIDPDFGDQAIPISRSVSLGTNLTF